MPGSPDAPAGDSCVDALGVSRLDGCYGYRACGAGGSGMSICTCRDGALVECGTCANVEAGERAERPASPEPSYCGGAPVTDAGPMPVDAAVARDAGPPPPADCTPTTGPRVRAGECGWSGEPATDGLFCRCTAGRFDCADRSCGDGPPLTRISAATVPLRGELEVLSLAADSRLFVSNNPETVTSAGILASTMPIAPGAMRSTYDGAPAPRVEGSAVYDTSCPAGHAREMDVYIAHIGSAFDFGVGVVPASGDITVRVEGDLASGPWDTRSPEFVSARVMREFYSGSRASRSVSAPCDASAGVCRQYTEVDAAPGAVRNARGETVGAYVDGRLRLSSSGCFATYVIARARGSAVQTRVPSTWAVGNTAWPGWFGGRGAGRSNGVYGGGELSARADAPFNGPGQSRGYAVGLESTAQAALMRLTDSARVNFGDYGGRYDLRFRARNATRDCLRVRSELVSYASTSNDQRPTFRVYHPSYARDPRVFPTVFWNSHLERSGGAEGTRQAHVALHVPTPFGDTPDVVPQMRGAQHDETLRAGESRELRLRIQVPGLITAPLGIVLTTEACR